MTWEELNKKSGVTPATQKTSTPKTWEELGSQSKSSVITPVAKTTSVSTNKTASEVFSQPKNPYQTEYPSSKINTGQTAEEVFTAPKNPYTLDNARLLIDDKNIPQEDISACAGKSEGDSCTVGSKGTGICGYTPDKKYFAKFALH